MNSIPPQLRTITAREIVSALERDGFIWTQRGTSHRVYRKGNRRVVIAYHRPGATFRAKTLESILKGTSWTEDDLRRLGLIK